MTGFLPSNVISYDEFGNALDTPSPIFGYFENVNFGRDMAQDARFTGTPDDVYLDNAEWTMSAIAGTWDFASTTQVQSGTVSIDGTLTNTGSIAQAQRSTPIDLNNYDALSGWVYIDRRTNGDCINIYAYDTTGAAVIGNAICLNDYIEETDLNVWQPFNIPFEDMGIETETIDTLRFEVVDASPLFNFYLDTIQIQESGSLIYKVEPPSGTWLEVNSLNVEIVRTGVVDYDVNKFAGLTITNPSIFNVIIGGTSLPTGTQRNLSDFLNITNTTYQSITQDTANTNCFFNTQYNPPIRLKSETSDALEVVLSDKYDDLDVLQVSYYGQVYTRG